MWDLFQSTYSSLLFTSLGFLPTSGLNKNLSVDQEALVKNTESHREFKWSCFYFSPSKLPVFLKDKYQLFFPQRVPLVELQICCFISILIFPFHCETFFFYTVSYSIVICTFIASVIVFTLLLFAIGNKVIDFFWHPLWNIQKQ